MLSHSRRRRRARGRNPRSFCSGRAAAAGCSCLLRSEPLNVGWPKTVGQASPEKWHPFEPAYQQPVRTLSTPNGQEQAAGNRSVRPATPPPRPRRSQPPPRRHGLRHLLLVHRIHLLLLVHTLRTRTPRPSLRPPQRLASLPGRPVLRCRAKRDPGEPPLLLEAPVISAEREAEPAGRDSGGLPPFDASWGLALAAAAGALLVQGSQQALAGTQFMGLQPPADVLGNLGDISTGFSADFLSELGDRTFFIAALLAARNSGGIIFLGTFGALAVMTVISVVLGRAFHYVDGVLPFSFGGTDFPIDDILAVCLLVYYGVTTLLDAASGDGEKMNEEQEEAEIAVSKFSGNGAGLVSVASTLASTFVLVFVAEWGDKSFFSTIALAAASSPPGVIAGSLAGHGVATLIAVLGGSLLGTFLSEKIIAYIGGSLFLAFAAVTLVEIATS